MRRKAMKRLQIMMARAFQVFDNFAAAPATVMSYYLKKLRTWKISVSTDILSRGFHNSRVKTGSIIFT